MSSRDRSGVTSRIVRARRALGARCAPPLRVPLTTLPLLRAPLTIAPPLRVALTIPLLLALVLVVASREASAQARTDVPSVLVIDSCLGDYDLCVLHWLGENSKVVAEDGDTMLATAAEAAWWKEGGGADDAPATFVLGTPATDATVSAEDIAWALDRIRDTGSEPRTFVVAMGLTGLPLREYAEDLAPVAQSSRADLVGMAFCGTPHNGYSAMATYPELPLWQRALATVGLAADDLDPQSAYLERLNAGSFPSVTKTLLVSGAVGDLGFGQTDGLCCEADLALSGSLTTQAQTVRVGATVGQSINLTSAWDRFTSPIDHPDRAVDDALADRLSAIAGYETSDEVKEAVRAFYDAWFAGGTPVTYSAHALLLDLSGSMLDDIDAAGNKLAAGKEASKEYLRAMQAVSELPQSAPMGVSVIGFAETTTDVASSFDKASCDAVEAVRPAGETNIGLALDRAIAYLGDAPTCADRHVLLLSDGASTRGQTESQIMTGSVAQAQAAGIAIDTIGFGDIGESDAGFLKGVSEATGGTYYSAQDTYGLKSGFLGSYYSSLGLGLVDEEVAQGSPATVSIGSADAQTTALEVGIVSQLSSPQVVALRDGKELDAAQYVVHEEYGLTSVRIANPRQGAYSLALSGDTGSMHVFAVRQRGIAAVRAATPADQDHAPTSWEDWRRRSWHRWLSWSSAPCAGERQASLPASGPQERPPKPTRGTRHVHEPRGVYGTGPT